MDQKTIDALEVQLEVIATALDAIKALAVLPADSTDKVANESSDDTTASTVAQETDSPVDPHAASEGFVSQGIAS